MGASSDKKNVLSFGPWWNFYLARVFGKKVIQCDFGIKLTMYCWRGRVYVWKAETI